MANISDFKNVSCNPTEEDQRPGNYYVSVVSGNKFGLLLGPYNSHKEALDKVETAREKAKEVNRAEAAFAGFGTVRVENHTEPGLFNRVFGM